MSALPTQPLCGVCPTCNRRFTNPKRVDKKLSQDTARAERAIEVLAAYTDTDSLSEACKLESNRLRAALTDHKLLWSIYRRADKATGYGISVVRTVQS